MNNKIKCLVSLALCFSMLAGFAGCKKQDPEDSAEYSVVYEYRKSGNTDDTSDESAVSENGSSNKSSKKTVVKKSGSKKSSGNTVAQSTPTGGKTISVANKESLGRAKDLKGREIIYVASWDPTATNSHFYKEMQDVAKQFNCKFTEKKMTNYKALYTSILAGQPLADLFCPYDADVLNLAGKNLIVPLDTLSSLNFDEESWNQAVRTETSLGGHVYGMVRGYQVRQVLMYNKTLFKKNNWSDLYDLQKAGKLDWATLFDIMKKATSVSGSTVNRYGLIPTYSIGEFGFTMLHANGVAAVTRVPNQKMFKYTLDSDQARRALNTFHEWVNTTGAVYDCSVAGWDSGREMFYSGKGAMTIIDYQDFGKVVNNADFDIGMVLFPHGPDTKNDLIDYTMAVTCIAANTKNPDDVALFWDVLADYRKEGYELKYFEDSLPDPSVKSTLERYYKDFASGKYVNEYLFRLSGDYKTVLGKVGYGETTAAACISSISQTVQAKMNDFWK